MSIEKSTSGVPFASVDGSVQSRVALVGVVKSLNAVAFVGGLGSVGSDTRIGET